MARTRSPLGRFDGREVAKATIAVTNAGDGLSKAMGVDPQQMDIGDKVYVVLECDVSNIKFSPLPDDPKRLVRTHTLKAGTATIVDEDLVRDHLDNQQQRIEEAQGIQRLPMDADGGDAES